jgi:prefoldin subunit 5
MDAKLIKNQISYWESQQKDMEKQSKALEEQIKTVKATIKNLRSLLPKDTVEPEPLVNDED